MAEAKYDALVVGLLCGNAYIEVSHSEGVLAFECEGLAAPKARE